jgi:hypothetical protein
MTSDHGLTGLIGGDIVNIQPLLISVRKFVVFLLVSEAIELAESINMNIIFILSTKVNIAALGMKIV